MPYFSVIIPSYNRKEMLRNAINSVIDQDYRDFEIIVVDDGSFDGTSELADEYKGSITYIYQENSGVSAARNKGILSSSAPHIALLDSDDTWHKNKLSKHREFIRNNPGIFIHQTEDIWIRNGIRVNPGLKHAKPHGRIFIPSLQLCLISPSSVCISRTLIDEYGMFDDKLPACEDYDLWLRITAFEEVGLIGEKLITRYAGHDDQLSALFWGMDRFRIYSMLKLLHHKGELLDPSYKKAAVAAAIKKIKILLNGVGKRGKETESIKLAEIISQLEGGSCTQTDYLSLLEI